jgi:hypothetical protein
LKPPLTSWLRGGTMLASDTSSTGTVLLMQVFLGLSGHGPQKLKLATNTQIAQQPTLPEHYRAPTP